MRPALALAALLAASPCAAQLSGPAEAQGGMFGKKAPNDTRVNAGERAANALKMSDRLELIVQFINEHGCLSDKNGRRKATTADVTKAIDDVRARYELVFLSQTDFTTLFKQGANIIAIGVCGENRATLELPVPGDKNKDLIAYKSPTGEEIQPDAVTTAHELLHIVLNQFGNPELGGGDKKPECAKPGKDAPGDVHQLTEKWFWNGVGQKPSKPWTPGGLPGAPPSSC